MKERSQLTLLIIVLLVLGAAFIFLQVIYSSFTFYKSEINIQGNVITEKLYYTPNQAYHTLYRNFETLVAQKNNTEKNNIQVLNVDCSDGTPYYVDYTGQQVQMVNNTEDVKDHVVVMPYTSMNEYGCGFGNDLGFSKDKNYTLKAFYVLNPNTLIEHNGKHYIKFVAYSGARHPFLNPDSIKITGVATYAKYVASSSKFLIYIPYEPDGIGDYQIIHESILGVNNSTLALILYILMAILPAIICYFTWRYFGKEYDEGDYPEELSLYPQERKAWEVSVYFHPPFGNLDENFVPAMILDFYNRKIIDLDVRKTGLLIKSDEVFIKILPTNIVLDKVESGFMDFLKYVKSLDKSSEEYFSVKSISTKFGNKMLVTQDYEDLKRDIKEQSKEYIEYTGVWVLTITLAAVLILLSMIIAVIGDGSSEINRHEIYFIIIAVVLGYVVRKSTLFIRFKKEHYNEYQQWQGFKNYLSHLDSIPRTSFKGVVMWEKYLVYATCMGVGKKVLEEMRKLNIVNQQYYNRMSAVYVNAAFGSTSSTQSGGGGMGGGGIGGGGGGGR